MSHFVVKPRLLRLSYFIWLIVPVAVFGLAQTKGLPHMRWSYRYIDQGVSAPRYYTECTYIGLNGVFVVSPLGGHCGFIKLFRAKQP